MLTPKDIEEINKKYLPANIIWFSFLLTLVLYVVLCTYLSDEIYPIRIDSFTEDTLKFSLIGAAMAILVITFLLRTSMLEPERYRKTINKVPEKQRKEKIGNRYFTAIILSMALSEVIGIFGIVLFFISKDNVSLYQFMVFSGIAMIYFKPRKGEILDFARGLEKGSDKYIKNTRVWDNIE